MNPLFLAALARIFALEKPASGTWVDDPHDPGGLTNEWGISLRFALGVKDLKESGHPMLDVDGDGDIDREDIIAMPRDLAERLAYRLFWLPLRCNELPPPTAALVFDAGYNQGRGPAVTMLQEVLRVKADGWPGPITFAAAARWDDVELATLYSARRSVRYAGTLNFDRYGLGWNKRSYAMFRFACPGRTRQGGP